MREARVERVRELVAAWDSRDADAIVAMVADDFVMDWSRSTGPDPGVYRGREGVHRYASAFLEAWDEFGQEFLRVTEVGPDALVTEVRTRMRGGASGVEISATASILWRFRGAEPVRAELYQSYDEALAAARAEPG